MLSEHLISLDEQAARTWPARFCEPLGSWLLRANPGLASKRANSVLAVGAYPDAKNWMELAERFYERFQLPTRFHVSPASPEGLDLYLEQAGFVKETVTSLMIADCRAVCANTSVDHPFEIRLKSSADPAWTAAFVAIEQFDPVRTEAYQQMLDRIAARKAFVEVRENGSVIGIGTAVLERNRAGLINIATDLRHRRKGVGQQIVRGLAEWSLQNGAEQLYLQVLADNVPAKRLYEKVGFEHAYDYHYRTRYPR